MATAAGLGARAATLPGNPPVTRMVTDLEVYPQNFDVAQGADSIVYVANDDGVLAFDGERWQLIALPNGDLARSLASDRNGRVYVGGFNHFGYLDRDAHGVIGYHDLTGLFAKRLDGEAFFDIWGITIAPQGVLFQAVKHLFWYEPGSGRTRMWRHDGRFGATVRLGDDLLAQFRGQGLKRYRDGRWKPVAGGAAFQQLVYAFLPTPRGGLLTLARDGRFRIWRQGQVGDYAMPAGLTDSSRFSASLVTDRGTLVLGTSDGALYFIDLARHRLRRMPLAHNRIVGLAQGHDGGLFAATDRALYRVSWPSDWTLLGTDNGLAGGSVKVVPWARRWYVLSTAGVFAAQSGDGDAMVQFKRLDWTRHEAWDLLPLNPDQALLAQSYALQLIDHGQAHALSGKALYPRVLLRSRFNRDVVYIGTELGLAVLRRDAGKWHLVLEYNRLGNLTVSALVETGPGVLWLGTARGGVLRVQLADAGSRIAKVMPMGPEQGIDYGDHKAVKLQPLRGDLVASTATGLFRWNGKAFVRDDFDGLAGLLQPGELVVLAAAADGTLWALAARRVWRRPVGEGWREQGIGAFRRGALQSITFADHGVALLSTTAGVLRYQDLPAATHRQAPRVLLRSVHHLDLDSGSQQRLSLQPRQPAHFVEGDFGMRFGFALPAFRRPDAVRYQARLTPWEARFSAWSGSRGFTYSRLDPGHYRFEVRARDGLGRESRAVPFEFVVEPPWYARTWARLLWLAIALALLLLLTHVLVRLRTRRLALETARLEGMVAQRTRELESANRKLDAQAHLDGLTRIANRRRLDDYLAEMWQQCAHQQRCLSVLLLDVDHFKNYNDQHGHQAGDRLLQQLAETLSGSLRRAEDLVARYGGEEFLVVLPGVDADRARARAEAMRAAVEESGIGATVSIGVATTRPPAISAAALVRAADKRLYDAKATGRNRVSW